MLAEKCSSQRALEKRKGRKCGLTLLHYWIGLERLNGRLFIFLSITTVETAMRATIMNSAGNSGIGVERDCTNPEMRPEALVVNCMLTVVTMFKVTTIPS